MIFQSDWSDGNNPARREILFEHRNKSYGAYIIRRQYTRNVFVALLITILLVFTFIAFPYISGFFQKQITAKSKTTGLVILEEPPPIDKVTPPPPPLVEPPPLHTIKFTPPVIVPDAEAEEPPPTQDEIKNIQVSTVSQEGADIIDLPTNDIMKEEIVEDKIFTIVEEMPHFPGGDKELLQRLARINYPITARENGISGAVYLSFVVEKDGRIKDAKILKGIGGGCDEEALRVLMTLPDWIPGKQNGRPVAVRSSVRVNFTLQ
jgi:protein TonB